MSSVFWHVSKPPKLTPKLTSQLVVSGFYLALLFTLGLSVSLYWSKTLIPRLYSTAETQAKLMAEAQGQRLQQIINSTAVADLDKNLRSAAGEMLITENPAVGGRQVLGIKVEMDYSEIEVEAESLDFFMGDETCERCFVAQVPLLDASGDLIGIATYHMSNQYFLSLSSEMKARLFNQSVVVLLLIVLMWMVMIWMLHRLHESKAKVEASDRAKTQFLANVSHELRTPLNSILGYSELNMSDHSLQDKFRQDFATIHSSAHHLLGMINDILDFSEGDDNAVKLVPEEIKLSRLLDGIVDMVSVKVKSKGIRLKKKFNGDTDQVVSVDQKRLRQVLINLLGNAVKFTETGNIHFIVDCLQESPASPNVTLTFTVEDTGSGIPEDKLKQIFLPFFQLDNDVTRSEGYGLGLAISAHLVELMGGKLMVASKVGEGSRFWFSLEVPSLQPVELSPSVKETDIATNTDTTSNQAAREIADRVEVTLPEAEVLDKFMKDVLDHNVIAVRDCLSDLSSQKEYQGFCNLMHPYLKSYQFKAMHAALLDFRQS